MFEIFWKANIKPKGAPVFDNIIFKRLINQLRIDYDEFFPLRSYIDKRTYTLTGNLIVKPWVQLIGDGAATTKIDLADVRDTGIAGFVEADALLTEVMRAGL